LNNNFSTDQWSRLRENRKIGITRMLDVSNSVHNIFVFSSFGLMNLPIASSVVTDTALQFPLNPYAILDHLSRIVSHIHCPWLNPGLSRRTILVYLLVSSPPVNILCVIEFHDRSFISSHSLTEPLCPFTLLVTFEVLRRFSNSSVCSSTASYIIHYHIFYCGLSSIFYFQMTISYHHITSSSTSRIHTLASV